MFSVVFAAGPGLPLCVASASCCCTYVPLKKLSKKKDPRKAGKAPNGWGVTTLVPVCIEAPRTRGAVPLAGEQVVGWDRLGDRALLPCSERHSCSSCDSGLAAHGCLHPQRVAAVAVQVLDCPGENEGGGGGVEEKKVITEAVFLLVPEWTWCIRNALVWAIWRH